MRVAGDIAYVSRSADGLRIVCARSTYTRFPAWTSDERRPFAPFVYSRRVLPPLSTSVRLACIAGLLLGACSGGAAPIADTRSAASCPTHLDLELIGRESRFDPGSTGIAHGVGLALGSDLSVEVSECDDECRRCKFRGPVRADPAIRPVISQRCLNDVSIACVDNAECPGMSGPCRFMFPPIAARTAAQPTCSIAYFEPVTGVDPSPFQGVIDLVTGETAMQVLTLLIQAGISGSCPDCQGDPQPFDGVRGGTCTSAGAAACDVSGIGTTISSLTSYDCPPPPNGLTIKLPASGTSTASRKWTLDGTRPKCTRAGAATAEPCWCGVCSNGTPCTSNLECATGTCGFAGTVANPVNVSNNGCADPATCTWNETTQRGTCSNDATKTCFPDGVLGQSMVATGEASVGDGFYIAQLANLVCLPSFGNGLIDAFAGFPGPLRFEARFRVTPRRAAP